MQNLKDRKPLLIKILAAILLTVLCCNLPGEILFWKFCTEQDREIPPNTEVIVSACKRPNATGVPGGEVLFVHEGRGGRVYLLDLRTGEKRKVPKDQLLVNKGIFLSSKLVWLEDNIVRTGQPSYVHHYILDLTNGQRYELLNLDRLPRLEDGKFDPKNYTYFQSAKQVFVHYAENTLIALSSDFRDNPNGRVVFSAMEDGESLVQLMVDLGVGYENVDIRFRYSDDFRVSSPSGKYFAHYDGIYLSETNSLIVPIRGFTSWYYDESGIAVEIPGSCEFDFLVNCFYYVSGPIIKLHLPVP